MNGCGLLSTYRSRPLAMRFIVLGFSGRLQPMAFASSGVRKIDGQGSDQSMISAAVRHERCCPDRTSGESGLPCVGSGQTMGLPSQRAITNSRLRIVGAP